MSVSVQHTAWRCALVLACSVSTACSESGPGRAPQPSATEHPCEHSSECQDGLACNGEEQCESGRCVAGSAPNCEDGDRCTLDGCNEGSGCVHVASAEASCRPDASQPVLPPSTLDAGALDAAALDADVAEAGPLAPPADLSRPPDVPCPTSVGSIYADSNQALLPFRGIACSAGMVRLSEAVTDLSPLDQLRRAGSFEYFGPGSALSALLALERVDGTVWLHAAPETKTVAPLAGLRWVGGDLRLYAAVTGSDPFPRLRYVGGNVALTGTAEASTTSTPTFSALEAVGGAIQHNDSVGFVAARFPVLDRVGGMVTIGDGVVAADALSALRLAGGISIFNASLTGEIVLPALERAGTIRVLGNPGLTALNLPKLNHATALEVRLNPRFSRCQVDALLARVHDSLRSEPSVCCNQGCAVCDVGRCQEPGPASAGQSTTLPRFDFDRDLDPAAFTSVEHAMELRFQYPTDAPMPSFALRDVSKLYVAEQLGWTSLLGFSQLRSADTLVVTRSGLKTLAGLEHVESIGTLGVAGNDALTDVSALEPGRDVLRPPTGSLTITDNAALSQCEAERVGRLLGAITDAGITIARNGPCPDAGP